jgi:hypothetical protein
MIAIPDRATPRTAAIGPEQLMAAGAAVIVGSDR